MTKSQVKKIVSTVVAIVLAVAGAYGYVDENCTCSEPTGMLHVTPDTDSIFTGESNPVSLSVDDYLFLLLAQSEAM